MSTPNFHLFVAVKTEVEAESKLVTALFYDLFADQPGLVYRSAVTEQSGVILYKVISTEPISYHRLDEFKRRIYCSDDLVVLFCTTNCNEEDPDEDDGTMPNYTPSYCIGACVAVASDWDFFGLRRAILMSVLMNRLFDTIETDDPDNEKSLIFMQDGNGVAWFALESGSPITEAEASIFAAACSGWGIQSLCTFQS